MPEPDPRSAVLEVSAGRWRCWLWGGLLTVAAAGIGWLTADPPIEGRRLFGLWRNSHFLALVGSGWLALLSFAAGWSRRSLFAVLAVSLSVGFVVGVLELAALTGRVEFTGLLSGPFADTLGGRRLPLHHERGSTLPDIAARWGLPAEPIAFDYQTDRWGFRNAVDREAADVYLLGDSVLVAGLIPAAETVAAQLEARLGRPVMNLALIDTGQRRQLAMLQEVTLPTAGAPSLPLKGRWVLQFVFEGNDLQDAVAARGDRTPRSGLLLPQEKGTRPGMRERSLVNHLLLRLAQVTQPEDAIAHRRYGTLRGQTYWFLWTADSYVGTDGAWLEIQAALTATRDYVEQAGGQYAIVLVPAKIRVLGPLCSWPADSDLANFEHHYSPFRDQLLAWCGEANLPCLELTDPLSASARRGEVPFFAADTHLNAIGHRVLAESLAQSSVLQPSHAAPKPSLP